MVRRHRHAQIPVRSDVMICRGGLPDEFVHFKSPRQGLNFERSVVHASGDTAAYMDFDGALAWKASDEMQKYFR
jgi:hypothetical protein